MHARELNNCLFGVFVGVLWFGFSGFYGRRILEGGFLGRRRRGFWLCWGRKAFTIATVG